MSDLQTYPGETSFSVTTAPARRKAWFPVLCFVIVAITTLIQIGCLKNSLVIDDNTLVFDNDGRGCTDNPADCFKGKLFHLYYRPVLTASFAFVQRYKLHDNGAIWFHAENLLLHAIVVALALAVFRMVLRRRRAALIAGALFGIHPVQVCVTTFVGGRTDPLALMFVLVFIIGVIRASRMLRLRSRCALFTSKVRHPSGFYVAIAFLIALSSVALLGAAFTKEQVIPLILLAPLFAAHPTLRRGHKHGLETRTASGHNDNVGATRLWLGIYLLPVVAYLAASRYVLKGDRLPLAHWSLPLHVEMVGRSLWYFVKTLMFPTVTTLHQSTLGPWDDPQYAVALLGYISAAAWLLTVVATWRHRRLRIMTLWVTLTLVSCLNIVPIPSQFASPYRAAIPLFGLAGLIGSLLDGLDLRRLLTGTARLVPTKILVLALSPAVAWCVYTTLLDVPNWADEMVLMKAEVAADPNYVPARTALGNYWTQPPKGTSASLTNALREYDTCMSQLFGKNTPMDQWAQIIVSPGMVRTMHSVSGLRYGPKWYIPQIIRGRGGVFHAMGRFDEAISNYSIVNAITPDDTLNNQALVALLVHKGEQNMTGRDFREAAECFKSALKVAPDDRDVRNDLIGAYRILGLKDKADAVFRMEDRFTGVIP